MRFVAFCSVDGLPLTPPVQGQVVEQGVITRSSVTLAMQFVRLHVGNVTWIHTEKRMICYSIQQH